jgi:hypothetical protein
MAYTPFPTFSSPEGGGITAVQMPASQMRFPTPNFNPRQREPEPTTLETIAPFMPLVTEGIMGLFEDEPEQLSRADFLKSIAVNPQEPTELEEARADAYSFLGAPQEADGFGLDEIANLAVASQMGRGADDYGRTYAAIRKAREDARRTTESNRASFIQKQIGPDEFQFLNLQNSSAAQQGVTDIRPGYFDKKTGQTWIQDPEHEEANEYGYRPAGPEWVDPSKLAVGDKPFGGPDPVLTRLQEFVATQSQKDATMGQTVSLVNNTLDQLEAAKQNPATQGTTAVSTILNWANNTKNNFRQIASLNDTRDPTEIFATNENPGGSIGREGTGYNARNLWLASQTGDRDQMDRAANAFQEATGVNILELMGETAYNNVAVRSNFLQLAYLAAATAGQTGRTLSDKDLAHFMAIVGIGKSNEPDVLASNLIRFTNQTIEGMDAELEILLPKRGMRAYDMDNPKYQSAIGMYYDAPQVEDETGQLTTDWLNYDEYRYVPFWERNNDARISRFLNFVPKYGSGDPDSLPFAPAPETQTSQEANDAALRYNQSQIDNMMTTPPVPPDDSDI